MTEAGFLNKGRLCARDYALVTDITQVMNECPTPLTFVEVLGKFKRIGLAVHQPALESIFDSGDTQGEGRIDPRLFIREYNYRVMQLSEEIFQLREKLEGLQGLIEALREQIGSPATAETVNSWGISEHSSLKVAITGVKGLNPPRLCQVVVMCERQRHATRPQPSNTAESWSEELEFKVVNGAGDVLFSLYADDTLLGQCAVPLPSLRDQKMHEMGLELLPNLRLCVSLQWLHNLRSHLQDEIVLHTDSAEAAITAIRGAESLLQELGLGGEEEWTDAVLRRIQVSLERVKQTSCSTDCSVS